MYFASLGHFWQDLILMLSELIVDFAIVTLLSCLEFLFPVNKRILTILLGLVSVVGAIGIQMGDPQFIVNALILESAFIALTILSIVRIRYVLIPCMVISIIVIIANTASPRHTEVMISFYPVVNALVLIIGGYVLQADSGI